MKTAYKSFIMYSLSILLTLLLMNSFISIEKAPLIKKVHSSSSPKTNLKSKKARIDHFNRMLRDPITKTVPRNIREKELNFARKLADKINKLNKTSSITSLTWEEAGPNNVGGRTRALAIDVNNSNVILAGGASGGTSHAGNDPGRTRPDGNLGLRPSWRSARQQSVQRQRLHSGWAGVACAASRGRRRGVLHHPSPVCRPLSQ